MAKKKEQTRWEKMEMESDEAFLEGCRNTVYGYLMEGYFPYRSMVESVSVRLMEWGLTPEELAEVMDTAHNTLERDYCIVNENREDPIKAIKEIFALDGIEKTDDEIREGLMQNMVMGMLNVVPAGEKN